MPERTRKSFNPARFTDVIKEDDYRVWTSGVALRKERSELIEWLHKKYNEDKPSLDLAHKLEACKRGARCKSAACPECSAAARDLVTEVAQTVAVSINGQQICLRQNRQDGELNG